MASRITDKEMASTMEQSKTHREPRSRAGSIVVTAVLFTAVMGLGGLVISRQLERDLARQLRSASDARELEPLLEAAVEEAHYQLTIGARPAASGADARAKIARASAGSKGDVPAAEARSEHDPVAFLRESNRAAVWAPECAAHGLAYGSGIEMDGVEIQVVDRVVGPWKRRASGSAGVGAGATDGAVGDLAGPNDLPTLFTALRTTWGVVEIRAAARWPRGRGASAARRLTVRRLFTVVDHAWDGGQTSGYAHVFPGSIARVMEGE